MPKLLLSPSAVLVAALASLSAAHSVAAPVYFTGHADIRPVFAEGAGFELRYHFGAGVEAEQGEPIESSNQLPGAVATRVPDPPFQRPEGSEWDFLGVEAGEQAWFIPQLQESGKPFLGFATDTLSPGEWDGLITWTITQVISRPTGGEFSLWQSDLFGTPDVKLATFDGIDLEDDQFTQGSGGHDHFNWGFSKPGVYELELTASAEHGSAGTVTGSGIFTFLVGNDAIDPSDSLPGDANRDGRVDLADFGALKQGFGAGHTWAEGDFDQDGSVDLSDFGILKSNFGRTAASAVPEPSGQHLALAALLGLLAMACACRASGSADVPYRGHTQR